MNPAPLTVPPFSELSEPALERVRRVLVPQRHAGGDTLYSIGEPLAGLYLLVAGEVLIADAAGTPISTLEAGDCFGERGLLRDGLAATTAVTNGPATTVLLPRAEFERLLREEAAFARYFTPGSASNAANATNAAPAGTGTSQPANAGSPTADPTAARKAERAALATDITVRPVAQIMTADPFTVAPSTTVLDTARLMHERGVSCAIVVADGRVVGLVTTSDLVGRVLAQGLSTDTAVADVMTPEPHSIAPTALGHDALLALVARRIGHFPVVDAGRLVGIVTRSDLLAQQSASAGLMILDIGRASDIPGIAAVVARIPSLLSQLVGSGVPAHTVTRLVTDVGDAATRRLIELAQERHGPAPVPWLWLACGSQGRQEQTGVSDQDNCMMIDDSMRPADDAWFAAVARFVSDGLDACGYFHCPGDMMATNPRWRQPVKVWQSYFDRWVREPDEMAQMLASVMFDLRPIAGDTSLFEGIHPQVLALARRNSIFVAHMIGNALNNMPPLSLLGRLSTIRSGAQKDTIDLKHAGVAPVVDLARIYALLGGIEPVNTRTRLTAARDAAIISPSGAADLIDAYDLVCEVRLEHQAAQVRAGTKPDNYMPPRQLSELARSHLRDAFVTIKTMQSALSNSRGVRR